MFVWPTKTQEKNVNLIWQSNTNGLCWWGTEITVNSNQHQFCNRKRETSHTTCMHFIITQFVLIWLTVLNQAPSHWKICTRSGHFPWRYTENSIWSLSWITLEWNISIYRSPFFSIVDIFHWPVEMCLGVCARTNSIKKKIQTAKNKR